MTDLSSARASGGPLPFGRPFPGADPDAGEARLRLLAELASDLITIHDAEGNFLYVSPASREMLGWAPEELLGGPAFEPIHPDDRPAVLASHAAVLSGSAARTVLFRVPHRDGRWVWLEAATRAARDPETGAVREVVCISRDVTGRRADEEERARLLESERRARAEAEAANRAKSEFLAVMSHELRTPLNAIGGYADLMLAEVRGPLAPGYREYVERVAAGQRHLLGLINSVLNFARLEAGRVTYVVEAVPVSRLLEGIGPLVEPQVRAKGLAFARAAADPALVVRADAEKAAQVLLNLLSNAVKFTDAGGRVTLEAAALPDGTVALRVRDTGSGIPPERLEQVFEPFVQLDTRLTRRADGVGLGLAISRDLARAMGGDLLAESVPGEGSTFTLKLRSA